MPTGGSSAHPGPRFTTSPGWTRHAKPGVLLVDAVRDWRPTVHRPVAWVSGESSMTTAVRRILVKSGVAKADISFHGYFKFGKSQYDD